jgi:hypothetical protein
MLHQYFGQLKIHWRKLSNELGDFHYPFALIFQLCHNVQLKLENINPPISKCTIELTRCSHKRIVQPKRHQGFGKIPEVSFYG